MSASTAITFPNTRGHHGYAAFLFALASCALVILFWGDFARQALFHCALLGAASAVIYIAAGADHPDRKLLLRAFFIAYALRFFLVIVWHAFSADGLFFLDDVTYDAQATALVASVPVSELGNAASYLGTSHVAYPVLLSCLYRWLGHSVLCATLLNALFGAAIAPVAYWATYELTRDRTPARTALWISTFFFYEVGWALFLMRDTILLFFFSLSIAALVSFIRRRSLGMLAIASFSLVLLAELRFYSVYILVASAAVASFLWLFPDTPRARLIGLTSAIILAIVAGVVFLGVATPDLGENIPVAGDLLLKADAFQAKDVFQLLIPSASLKYVGGLAMGALRYSFHPLAWVFWDIEWIGTVFYPGMYVIYFFLPMFFVGLWIALRELKPLAVLFFSPLLLHALVQIHLYQGGDRQRMMVDMLFVTAAAIGWQHRAEFRKAIRLIYAGFFAIVGLHLAWHFVRYLI